MHAHQVFKHPEKGLKAVKRGFSWPGFFFTWIWALTRQLWLAGGLLLICAAALAALNLSVGGRDLPFLLAVDIAFLLFVGFKGNLWRGNTLEGRGYAFIGAINARNPGDAAAKVVAAGGTIPPEPKAPPRTPGFFQLPPKMRGLYAVIALTWKATIRYRLFWVIAALLICAVVGLPLLIKDDGTAQGFAQILITYTLGSITGLLGLCTLWLACGTLAKDVEEFQIPMVVVKPIARWQIWLGKWLGLVSLNAVLLAIAGACIYGLLEWRAKRLPPDEFAKLKNEVLVARGSARPESLEKIIQEKTDEQLQEKIKKGKLDGLNVQTVRQQIELQVRALAQVVPPGQTRPWVIPMGAARERLKDQPMYLRVKFNSAQATGQETFYGEWAIGNPQKMEPWQTGPMSLAPDTFHEFEIKPNLFDDDGQLIVFFKNMDTTALLFPLDDGIEVLYREGGFGFNFIRGLGIILCWMALLAALGLAAASFLSFPAAAFVALTLLAMSFSTDTLSTVVSQGTITGWDSEKSTYGHTPLDYFVVPAFHAALNVINLARGFSPIDSLSTGRSITWQELSMAVWQIVLLLGGIIGLFGIFVFNRRELATAQGTG